MLIIQLFDGQITDNFNLNEFKCNANGELLFNKEVNEHIHRLQEFRTWYNRVMKVASGYRTKEWNDKVNGAKESQHLLGLATDSYWTDDFYKASPQRKKEWMENMKNKWFFMCDKAKINGGVFFYDWGFHLDSRTNKPRGFDNFSKY